MAIAKWVVSQSATRFLARLEKAVERVEDHERRLAVIDVHLQAIQEIRDSMDAMRDKVYEHSKKLVELEIKGRANGQAPTHQKASRSKLDD